MLIYKQLYNYTYIHLQNALILHEKNFFSYEIQKQNTSENVNKLEKKKKKCWTHTYIHVSLSNIQIVLCHCHNIVCSNML